MIVLWYFKFLCLELGMLRNLYVGQKVKLSRYGYAHLKLDTPEAIADCSNLTITYVNNIGYPEEPIWDIHVDSPHIDKFLLHQRMFDEI